GKQQQPRLGLWLQTDRNHHAAAQENLKGDIRHRGTQHVKKLQPWGWSFSATMQGRLWRRIDMAWLDLAVNGALWRVVKAVPEPARVEQQTPRSSPALPASWAR